MSLFARLRWFMRARALAVPNSDFRGAGEIDPNEIIRLRLRRPIVAGSIITLVLVLGLLIWAMVFSIAGAVIASGTVKVEDNVKVLKHQDGGVIRQILVHEGQKVNRGQLLIRFDRVQGQAAVDIYQADHDSAEAQIAEFEAEAANAATIRFPADLLNRQSDPNVAAIIAGQIALFQARTTLYRSQAEVLRGQGQQIQTQIAGMKAQLASTDAQSGLIDEELDGVRSLNSIGYAPKSRLLALERSAAAIKGQRGATISDMARAEQAIGDIKLQIAQLDDKRETDAATGLREAQDKLTDIVPKLRATQESLSETDVRAPVSGYVFNLTQFTEGGVAGADEPLLEIVPTDVPLIITAQVRPSDIAQVHQGQSARITLTAFNPRTTPQVDGTVVLVSPDAMTDTQTHASYYIVQVKVDPGELAAAGKDVHLTPGMPATVAIATRKRTIMDYLLGPMIEALHTALREQ